MSLHQGISGFVIELSGDREVVPLLEFGDARQIQVLESSSDSGGLVGRIERANGQADVDWRVIGFEKDLVGGHRNLEFDLA